MNERVCSPRSIRCAIYRGFHKLCSAIAMALMEEQRRVAENETSRFIREREKLETLHGEWHRSPENVDKILAILVKVYGETNTYMVAHHILIQPLNSPRALEIPSFESMIFDPEFLARCSDDPVQFSNQLAFMDRQERLDYLHETICS